MKSNDLSPIDDQEPIPLKRALQEVDKGLIMKQKSLTAAIKLCVSVSGIETEKQIYMTLGIDPGHWARIMKGDAHFPTDKLGALMDFCGNEAPLLWIADQRGYELKPKESEWERRIRHEIEGREKAEARAELLEDILTKRGAI